MSVWSGPLAKLPSLDHAYTSSPPPPLSPSSAPSSSLFFSFLSLHKRSLIGQPAACSLTPSLTAVPGLSSVPADGRCDIGACEETEEATYRACAAPAYASEDPPQTALCGACRNHPTKRTAVPGAPHSPAATPVIHEGEPWPGPCPRPRELQACPRQSLLWDRDPPLPIIAPIAPCLLLLLPFLPSSSHRPHIPAHSRLEESRTMFQGGRLGSWDGGSPSMCPPHAYQEARPSCPVLGCHCWGPGTRSHGPRSKGTR